MQILDQLLRAKRLENITIGASTQPFGNIFRVYRLTTYSGVSCAVNMITCSLRMLGCARIFRNTSKPFDAGIITLKTMR